ncbi:MAG TPA: hypothetical protein VJ893_04265 [Roseovarius sp.]|nr:hypothetical protein [Roseovarius sp.]HMB12590.1 hypothetical protein [Roseovarius sp.]
MNRLLALFAFAVLAAFLYILASKIGALDLWIVTVFAAGLAAYDFITSSQNKS